jgi:hypothetical protein
MAEMRCSEPDDGLDEIDYDVDIAAYGFGVRTRLVRGVHERLGGVVFHARQADVQTSLKEVVAVGCDQIDFGVNGQIGWEGKLHLSGGEAHRADETSRPAGSEQLFRISAAAGRAGRGERDVEAPVGAAGLAVASTGGVRFAGVEYFFELRHGEVLVQGKGFKSHAMRSGEVDNT